MYVSTVVLLGISMLCYHVSQWLRAGGHKAVLLDQLRPVVFGYDLRRFGIGRGFESFRFVAVDRLIHGDMLQGVEGTGWNRLTGYGVTSFDEISICPALARQTTIYQESWTVAILVPWPLTRPS